MSTTACVTGATGYLATELIAQLLSKGYRVRATVRSVAKASSLLALKGADAKSLELLEADLLEPNAFDAAVRDAAYVFHTASPFVTSNITNAQEQLLRPSLEGTRNMFSSVVKAVSEGAPPPRVVLTSSVAAVMGRASDKETCFDEADWNFSSTVDGGGDGLDAYRYSKLAAEREAWALAEAHGLELATILPSFIVGPSRSARLDGESLSNMRMALEGVMPHRGDTPMVDVRDVAAAHIAAAETESAAGQRFITSSARAVPRARVLQVLREAYPDLAIVDGGPVPPDGREIFCSKTLDSIGVRLRPAEESLVDMAAAMLAHGVVKPAYR